MQSVESIERIASHQLGEELAQRFGTVEQVQARDYFIDGKQRARLVLRREECAHEILEVRLMRLIDR